jgi:hypothetical protein
MFATRRRSLDARNSITAARVRPRIAPNSILRTTTDSCDGPAVDVCVCVCVLVLLPASALQEIVSKDVAGKQFLSDSPLVFELSNPANGKKTYAGMQPLVCVRVRVRVLRVVGVCVTHLFP